MKNINFEAKSPMYFSVQLENDSYGNDARRVWLPLPATKKQFKEAWEAASGVGGSYVSINRYAVRVPGISRKMLYDTTLAKVNHLASRLAGFDNEQIMILNAIFESETMNLSTVEQFIELTYNTERYTLDPDVMSEEDLGRRELNKLKDEHLPRYILNCIGLHDFGMSIAETQKGEFTALGYLIREPDCQSPAKKYSVPAALDLKGEYGEDLYTEEYEFLQYEEYEELKTKMEAELDEPLYELSEDE